MFGCKNVTLYIDIQSFHYIPPYLVPHRRIYPSYQLALLPAYILGLHKCFMSENGVDGHVSS